MLNDSYCFLFINNPKNLYNKPIFLLQKAMIIYKSIIIAIEIITTESNNN